jgi:hypothetical protein
LKKTTRLIVPIALAGMLLTGCGTTTITTTNTSTASNTNKPANTNAASTTANANATANANTTATSAAGDNVFTNQEAGVTFTVPAGWKVEPNGEQVQVSSPDDSVTIVLWVPDTDSFEEAAKAMGEQIDSQLDEVQSEGEGKESTVNGMPAYTLSGTGKYEGTPVHWAVDLIKAKKPFIALSIGESAKLQQHLDGYKKLVQSIKPV